MTLFALQFLWWSYGNCLYLQNLKAKAVQLTLVGYIVVVEVSCGVQNSPSQLTIEKKLWYDYFSCMAYDCCNRTVVIITSLARSSYCLPTRVVQHQTTLCAKVWRSSYLCSCWHTTYGNTVFRHSYASTGAHTHLKSSCQLKCSVSNIILCGSR